MKIWFVTSECAPFSKSGGLADVAYSLPPALKRIGHQITILTPLYTCVRKRFGDQLQKLFDFEVSFGPHKVDCGLWEGNRSGVPVWFIENDILFDRPRLYGYDDDKFRFAVFSHAVISLLDKELPFRPDILHCNDWETALSVVYLRNEQSWRVDLQGIKAVYTIHNIAYQGQFGANELWDCFGLPHGWYHGGLSYEYEGRHDINLMKGAMLMSNAVSTVSPNYARELHSPRYGAGLHGVVDMVSNKLYGILNGIDMDLYNPETDTRIASHFSRNDFTGKAVCKSDIQNAFGLETRADAPLLVSVARLVEQKGIELIKEALPKLMEMGVQLIIYGQGEQSYIDFFREAQSWWPGQLGFSSDYNEEMAARVFAGADYYLMPSRFEPCGLSQMMAMRYGTIPIVHETGGLKDSVRAYSDFDGLGDGFSFSDYTGQSLYLAIQSAVRMYFGNETMFLQLRDRCMRKDFSWDRSAEQYTQMYSEISDAGDGEPITFEEAFKMLKETYDRVAESRKDEIPQDYCRIFRIHITGRGDGFLSLIFTNGKLEVVPNMDQDADAGITASLDNLLGMATGTISADRLFLNGQLKITGNIVKGAEMRHFLTMKKESDQANPA